MQFTFPKNTFYCVALALGTFLSSCTKDGNIGPKGAPGEAGPAGQKGQTGSLYYKNGYLAGTITGVGKDGVTPIQETFRYEFSSNNAPLIYKAGSNLYHFNIFRFDSLNQNYASLNFTTPADFSSARFSYGGISYAKKVNDGQYKQLTGNLSLIQFTAPPPGGVTILYNEVTGELTGDYTWYVDNQSVNNSMYRYSSSSSTGKPFTVQGTFSVMTRPGTY